MRPAALAVALTLALAPVAPAQHIAPAEPKSPADERASFTGPPGFEVQLVAAEPDIGKPIQMAFDAKGRLWVTTSRQYPFPAAPGPGTDKLYVLSDFGPDGRARTVQVFADALNIPIGVLPLPDCKSCLASSAGVILKLTDTDGDGKADRTETLFTGFGFKDTHGMVNSFTLMPDGWVYACHGFANDSAVRGKDGHEVKVHSGNTLRFRPDGSRIEVFTRGQVNPFGMAVDPWLNLYTADCHSKPITQLIPGAVYPSFGKPHDGLGFGPDMIGHDHGSTALCGLTYYDADHFPQPYRHAMFLGNVVTNRVNFDRIEWAGGTPRAVRQPDFLVSKDPWFRPTDVKLGPDGALYVADFYNRIIGHYEVDLKHPERDKDRGRVWRVVWRGGPSVPAGARPPAAAFTDLTAADRAEIVRLLGHPNLTVRLLATHEAIRRGKDVLASGGPVPDGVPAGLAHRVWVALRTGALPPEAMVVGLGQGARRMAGPPVEFGMSQVFRALAAADAPAASVRGFARGFAGTAPDPGEDFTDRGTAEAVRGYLAMAAAHPHPDNVKPLLGLLKVLPAADTHLRHAARIALRNSLRDPKAWQTYGDAAELPADDARILLDVAFGLADRPAVEFLGRMLRANRLPANRTAAAAEHIGRHGHSPARQTVYDHLATAAGDPRQAAFRAFVRGVQASGSPVTQREHADALVGLAVAGLDAPTPAARVAALKTLGDLPGILPRGHRFGADGSDPSPAVGGLLRDPQQPDEVRAAALDALVRLDPVNAPAAATAVIDAPQTPPGVLERAALVLATSKDRSHKLAAKDALKRAPYRSAVPIAAALADSTTGGDVLLDAVRKGIAPARLLQEKQVLDRLRAAKVPDLDRELTELTKTLPPADQKLAELMKQRAKTFVAAKADRAEGARLFVKHCGACHQVAGQGGKVGPQLDGIGVRGLERLLEDVLDPNRNVDAAFRARVLTLADGRTLTGLMLRAEGEVLVFADAEGKESRIPLKDVEKNRETALSPMPANIGEAIPEADFRHLMAYLLALQTR